MSSHTNLCLLIGLAAKKYHKNVMRFMVFCINILQSVMEWTF